MAQDREWNGDKANHPQIHANRFPPEAKALEAWALEQQRRRRISDATHYLSAQDLKDFPTMMKYWGLKTESHTYDSSYGDRGQPDMTTSHTWSIVTFDTDEALEAWVLERVERRETYRVVKVEPVKTEVKAVFSIAK